MKELFQETRTSLTDTSFAHVVVKKSIKETLVYWTKYLLLITAVLYILLLFFITYSVPRLPKHLTDFLPTGQISSQNNQLSTTIKQPLAVSIEGYTITSDLEASPSAIDAHPAGVLLLKDRYISKSLTGETYTHMYGDIPSFTVSKESVIQYVVDHRLQIWAAISVISLVLVFVSGIFTWLSRQFSFLVSAVFVWLVSVYIFKKKIDYVGAFKLIVYASILPMLLSAILLIIPNDLLAALNFGLFVYLIFSWVRVLPPAVKDVATVPPVVAPSLHSPKKKSSRRKKS